MGRSYIHLKSKFICISKCVCRCSVCKFQCVSSGKCLIWKSLCISYTVLVNQRGLRHLETYTCNTHLRRIRRIQGTAGLPARPQYQGRSWSTSSWVIVWQTQDNQGLRPSQHEFTKGWSCLTIPVSSYDWVTLPVDEEKAVDVDGSPPGLQRSLWLCFP